MHVNPTIPLLLKALPLIFACICLCQAQPPQTRTRERFATLMSQVSPAMTREEVEAILGKPDDVRTKYDPGGIRRAETEEIWRYGTNGHLLVVSGYSLFGQAEDPKSHLNYFREHGMIRSLPLVPPPAPLASIRKALDALSNDGTGPDGAPDYDMLFNQALWLLDSVYEVEDAPFGIKMYRAAMGDREKAVEAISRLKLRWGGKKQDYTFADGTTLRIDRHGPYRRNIWEPDIPKLNLTLTIERINRKAIEVSVFWTGGEQELRNQPGVIRIYNASDRSLPIAQFKVEYLKNGSTSTGATIKYEESQVLVAVFAGEKTTAQSPAYKP